MFFFSCLSLPVFMYLSPEDILKHFKMMQLHAPDTNTGAIEELDWTSKEPLSERAFLDAQGNMKLPTALPFSTPPRDPTAPPKPTGGPPIPSGPS